MKTKPIYYTEDYSIFDLIKVNREVDPNRREAKNLFKSMKEHGFSPDYPILVEDTGSGSYDVIDGQHRLYFSQLLGIGLFYKEREVKIDISVINESQSGWRLDDHIMRWYKDGKKDYAEVIDFSRENGIRLPTSAGLLAGTASPGNYRNAITSGTYKVKTRKLANSVALCLKTVKETGRVTNYGSVIQALFAFHFVDYFDPEELIDKIKKNPGMLVNYGDRDGFMEMLEEVYNHRRRAKVPLAFDARQAMDNRKAVKKS